MSSRCSTTSIQNHPNTLPTQYSISPIQCLFDPVPSRYSTTSIQCNPNTESSKYNNSNKPIQFHFDPVPSRYGAISIQFNFASERLPYIESSKYVANPKQYHFDPVYSRYSAIWIYCHPNKLPSWYNAIFETVPFQYCSHTMQFYQSTITPPYIATPIQ